MACPQACTPRSDTARLTNKHQILHSSRFRSFKNVKQKTLLLPSLEKNAKEVRCFRDHSTNLTRISEQPLNGTKTHYGLFSAPPPTHTHTDRQTQTHTTVRPLVQDYPGRSVPEETLTHSHPSWSSGILYQLPPFTTIHSILFTQSSSSFRNTCPYHRSLFCCNTNAMSSIPSLSLSSILGSLSFSLVPHIHLTILISARWSATTFSFLTGQVSLPCNMLLHTQLQYNLPLIINQWHKRGNESTEKRIQYIFLGSSKWCSSDWTKQLTT